MLITEKQVVFLPFKGKKIILLDNELEDNNRKYLVMAHELAHAIEHSDIPCFYSSAHMGKGKLEREANQFTAELILGLYVERYGMNPTCFNDLKFTFGMDDEFMEYY